MHSRLCYNPTVGLASRPQRGPKPTPLGSKVVQSGPRLPRLAPDLRPERGFFLGACDMTDAANLVLRSLSDSAAEDGTIRPRLAHLRESTGLAAPDIFAALLTMEDAGLLIKAEPGPGLFRIICT